MRSISNILAGIAGPAGAQPRLERTGDGYSVVYDGTAERGNVAGGRAARLLGGGDDGTVLYTAPDPVQDEGRFATLSGGGDNAVLTYADPPAGTGAPASKVAGGAAAGAAAAGRRA